MSEDMDPSHWQTIESDQGVYYFNSSTGDSQWLKPAALKSAAELSDQNTDYYWVRHPHRAWVPAKPLSGKVGAGRWTVYETEETLDVKKANHIGDKIPDIIKTTVNTSDLVQLDQVEEPTIIHLLQRRFLKDEIWTSVGDILIAVNPFKRTNHFTPSESKAYRGRGTKTMPPHPYLVIDDAYNDMVNKKKDQSILISGESGAGKTYTVRVCMAYVSEIAGSPLGVEKKVMATNRVLESFGNAKTLRNDNSSRFGKFIQLYFDIHHKIIGCAIENYLLEKSRICFQQTKERNYHIFYYLTTQLDQAEKDALFLEDADQYHYTNQSGTFTGSSHDDEEEFNGARKDFEELGFSAEKISHIFEVTAAILHLGNAEFKSDGNTGSSVQKDAQKHVKTAAKLLGVEARELGKVMCGNVNVLASGEKIPVTFNPAGAVSARDALAKGIYGRLFNWLVESVNDAMFVTPEVMKKCNKIGMVDIFGFEIFKTNYFEQLSINFANEKLQQMFNKHTFLLEEETYKSEEIAFDPVTFYDSQPLLDILGLKAGRNAKLGIYQLLDEQTKINGTDKKFLSAVLKKYASSTGMKEGKEIKYIVQARKNKEKFTIEHYAGPVTYTSRGFIEKNADKLFNNQIELMASSSHPLLKLLFARDLELLKDSSKKGGSKKGGKKSSLNTQGGKFLQQLQQMENDIDQTWPRFIRCVKPNQEKVPNVINGGECLQQLRFAGVFEAVSIRKQGYPFRDPHEQFYRQYRIILPDLMKKESMPPKWKKWSKGEFKQHAQELLQRLEQEKGLGGLSKIQSGRTMMLYRATEFRDLRLRFSTVLNRHVVAMQALVRRWQMHRLYQELKRCAPIYRAGLESRNIAKLEKAIGCSEIIPIKFPGFHLLAKCKTVVDVFKAEAELKPKLERLLQGDIGEKYKATEAIIARMDGLIARDPEAFKTIKAAAQVRLAFELERDRRHCTSQADNLLPHLGNKKIAEALEEVAALDKLVQSVKKRAKAQGRSFSFFDNDEAATALKKLESEAEAVGTIKQCVANDGPRGVALQLDLSHLALNDLSNALATCKTTCITIDGRAAVEKGDRFLELRKQLKAAIESGEQKATHPIWKAVAEVLKPCTDFEDEDTAAELELVSSELAMRSEVEAVIEEMDDALQDLDVAKLGGATAKGAKLKLHAHPDQEIQQKFVAAVETHKEISRARAALLTALDGHLDQAQLEDAVKQAQSSRYGHEGMCGHKLFLKARQHLKWVCNLTRLANIEVGYLRVEQSRAIVEGCKKINLPLANADKLQVFLDLPKAQQLHRQVEAALDSAKGETQVWRAIECSIAEMDEFFSAPENMETFDWNNFEDLHEPDVWAKMNKVLFMRKFMRLSMRCWRVPENGLHAPLTIITAADSETEERLKKYAPEIIKSVCAFTGEDSRYAKDCCAMIHELLFECLREPALRAEAFCQILKHLTKTSRCPEYESASGNKKRFGPNEPDSIATWRVLLIMLLTFAPPAKFDKHLEQFLRKEMDAEDNSPTERECARLGIRALHQIRIVGDKADPSYALNAEEVAQAKSGEVNGIVGLLKTKGAHAKHAIDYVLQQEYSDPAVEPWEIDDDGTDVEPVPGGSTRRPRFEALYDRVAEDAGEIGFSAGDILIEVATCAFEGWRQLLHPETGAEGLGPASYLKELPDEPAPAPAPSPAKAPAPAPAPSASDSTTAAQRKVMEAVQDSDSDDENIGPPPVTTTGNDLEDGAGYFYAKFPYTAADEDELTVDKGTCLVCKPCPEEVDWLDAKIYPPSDDIDWKMIPESYVREMKPEEIAKIVQTAEPTGGASKKGQAPKPPPQAKPPAPKPAAPAPKPSRPANVPAHAKKVKAMYELAAADMVLGFSADDELWVVDHEDPATNADWYNGFTKDGSASGLVPRNYVE